MEGVSVKPAIPADAAVLAELVAAVESSLYGYSTFSKADLVDDWSDVDLERDTRVVRIDAQIVGYGAVRDRGSRWSAEGFVHPDVRGRGIGKLIATGLEKHAARRGARRVQSNILEADSAGRRLLESPVRVVRERRA